MVDTATSLSQRDQAGLAKTMGALTDGTNIYPIMSLRQDAAAVGAANPLAVAMTAGTAIVGKVSIDQTTSGTTNAVALVSDIRERFFDVAASTLTRAANQTPYSINDSISDNATPASVTALVATPGDVNDYPVMLTHIRVDTTDTGLAAACTLRVYVYNSDPTASTGVVGGDNLAFSNKRAGYVGTMSGSFRAFSDGGRAICVPEDGSYMIVPPASGTRNVWIQYQVLTAFTPSANSTTLIGRLVGIQGRS